MCWDVTEYLYVVASSTSLVVSSSHAARAAFEKFEEGISQSKRRMMRAIMGGRDRGRERLLRRWRGEEWEAVAPFALTVSSNRPFSWVVRIAHKHSSIERLERTQQCDPR